MYQFRMFPILKLATVALMVATCVQLANAGNKAQVPPNGIGKVEASISYAVNGVTNLVEAKMPLTGVAGTSSVSFPAAGVNVQATTGFPTNGNFSKAALPPGCPTNVFCTVTTERYTGGYKAVVRTSVTGGAVADNPDVEVKIPITPAACAFYDVETDLVLPEGASSFELHLNGQASAGTAIWLRALYYNGADADPSRDELIANSTLKGELVVAGPFNYESTCPARVPVAVEDTNKVYLLVDAVAKSVPFTMTCQDVVFECSSGNLQYPAPVITGGCETGAEATVSYSIAAGDLPLGVPTAVTATAAKDGGILATCAFTATVRDTTAPVKPALADVTVGQCSGTPTAPTTTDDCMGTITGTTTTVFPITTQGTTVVTWTFDDGNGNSVTADQNVIVKDTEPPETPVLPDVNVGQCSGTPPTPTTRDNCKGTVSGTTTTVFPITTQGTTVVTWTFDDGNGNSTSATQNVIVKDETKPVISGCPGNITVNTGPGRASCDQVATWTPPAASDNCALATLVGSHNPGATFPVGTTTVTYTATDAAGNSSACSFTVTVLDTTPPRIPSLPTIAGACGATVTLPVPTTTDNCGGAVTVSPNVPQVLSTKGTNVVQWTFTDGAGNSATAYQTGIVAGLTFKGFYAPIGTASNTCATAVAGNGGKTFPIKFDMLCGNSYVTGGQPPVVTIQKMKNCQPYGAPLVVNAVYQNDWHYNWNTDGCGRNEVYKFTVTLPDGQQPYVFIKIR